MSLYTPQVYFCGKNLHIFCSLSRVFTQKQCKKRLFSVFLCWFHQKNDGARSETHEIEKNNSGLPKHTVLRQKNTLLGSWKIIKLIISQFMIIHCSSYYVIQINYKQTQNNDDNQCFRILSDPKMRIRWS